MQYFKKKRSRFELLLYEIATQQRRAKMRAERFFYEKQELRNAVAYEAGQQWTVWDRLGIFFDGFRRKRAGKSPSDVYSKWRLHAQGA
ncbi:hypothetical protein [Chromobacterium amazonense]|uniref:hypothetical protein n=1 Tax=Chromobacterium amazonense TaxID=1382803 RepID=UPI001113C3B4|nr:hypothetical protein [Chromobacterium amazonense]